MLTRILTTSKRVDDYRAVVGDTVIDTLRHLGEPLRGARVLHVNATGFGGGVAEILQTMVPLMNDLGLQADWQVIRGADEFFAVTKAMHNSLQGIYVSWTPEMLDTWTRYNQLNADQFDESYDFVVIHDPQPAGVLRMVSERQGSVGGKWVWRCHIDLTNAQPEIWDFLRPYVEAYDGAIFTLQGFVRRDLEHPKVFVIPPAIDPLSLKNVPLAPETARSILQRLGIDTSRPLIVQVSRFDPFKDPLGVIEAYQLVKAEVPEVQLVLVASMAHDDPEAWSWYERTARRAGEDFDIYLLSNLNGVGDVEVNAFQSQAEVVVQKSLREGFGLTVAEGLWKSRPVVAGNVGGIPLQVLDGECGYLVDSVQQCAERVLHLLRHPEVAERMGKVGREHVRKNFLTTRYVQDYLQVFRTLSQTPSRDMLGQTAQPK